MIVKEEEDKDNVAPTTTRQGGERTRRIGVSTFLGIMDAERVYLQVACAGLGFNIGGEVWWALNQNGSSLTAIDKSFGSLVASIM